MALLWGGHRTVNLLCDICEDRRARIHPWTFLWVAVVCTVQRLLCVVCY